LTLPLLLLAAALWFAPWIATAFFLDRILAVVSQQLNGSLTARSVSAGWFRPLLVTGVRGHDAQGTTIIEVASLRTDKTLLALLFNTQDLGRIEATAPRVRCVVRRGGSNIEDFLAPLFETKEQKPLSVAWQVREGIVEFVPSSASRQTVPQAIWKVGALSGSFKRDQQQQVVQVSAQLRPSAPQVAEGDLQVELLCAGLPMAAQPFDLTKARGELTLVAQQIPLVAGQPLATRFTSGLAFNGTLDGQLRGRLDKGQLLVEWNELTVDDGRVDIPQLFAAEGLHTKQLASEGAVSWDADRLVVDTSLTSDFGTAQIKATSVAAGNMAAPLRLLSASELDLQADIDLPRLIAAAPGAFPLRDDVDIRTGALRISVQGQPQGQETRWTALLDTSDLAATSDNRNVVWPEPIHAELAARWSNNHLIVDQLTCHSEFLTATLEGTADEATVRVEGDLQRLTNRLQEFFALPIALSGLLDGYLHWTRRPPDVLVDGRLTGRNVGISRGSQSDWAEPEIHLIVATTLRRGEHNSQTELTGASAELTAGSERFVARVSEPLVLDKNTQRWPVDFNVTAQLDKWNTRLQGLNVLRESMLSGQLNALGKITWSAARISVQDMQGEISDLVFRSPRLNIVEPRTTFFVAGEWNGDVRRWATSRAEFATSTMAASGDDIQVSLADEQFAVAGELQFRADMARLQDWLSRKPGAARSVELAGELVGLARLVHSPQTTECRLDADIDGLELHRKPVLSANTIAVANGPVEKKLLWAEPRMQVRGQLRRASEARIDLQGLAIEGQGWQVSADGAIDAWPDRPVLRLDGKLDYDWEPLSQRLRSVAGPTLSIQGRRQDAFTLVGPVRGEGSALLSPVFKGSAVLGWQSATFQDIVAGPAEMPAELRNSVLYLGPAQIPLSEGTLNAAPRINLARAPARLEIPPGDILNDIRISPSMCRTWLKYVTPQVANATRAEGTFSLQLERFSLPLGEPDQGDVSGSLVIHEASIGAGPLAQQVLELADGITAVAERRVPRLNDLARGDWLVFPEQVVAFQMQAGRVFHRELRLQAKDVVLISRGSVGLDQTLDLTVEVPLLDRWIGKNRLPESMRGQSITVPLRGSLDRPALDDGAVRSLLIENAEKLLEDQILDGLERLFRND
jgi:hypothetical protein